MKGKIVAKPCPRADEKAALTKDIGVENAEISKGETKIAIPVSIQSKRLSKTTSHIAKRPAEWGVRSFDLTWAIADVPTPASLESIPLEKPSLTAIKDIPPPRADLKEKADDNIEYTAVPSRSKLSKITAKHIIM